MERRYLLCCSTWNTRKKYFPSLTILYKIFRYFVLPDMRSINKIFFGTLAMAYLAIGSACVYGQGLLFDNHYKKRFTIGFQTSREYIFTSFSPRTVKIKSAVASTLMVERALSKHFKASGGIKYSVVQNTASIRGLQTKGVNAYRLAAPMSLQYYFLPENSRFNFYTGAGAQFNFLLDNDDNTEFSSALHADPVNATGTRYISVLFKQGMTFQINTKIQLNQSLHFIPGNAEKTLGLDFGVDYRIH